MPWVEASNHSRFKFSASDCFWKSIGCSNIQGWAAASLRQGYSRQHSLWNLLYNRQLSPQQGSMSAIKYKLSLHAVRAISAWGRNAKTSTPGNALLPLAHIMLALVAIRDAAFLRRGWSWGSDRKETQERWAAQAPQSAQTCLDPALARIAIRLDIYHEVHTGCQARN